MSSNDRVPDPEVPAKARTRTFSASYKARILVEYETLDKAGKGALLRREGLYSSLLHVWHKQRDRGGRQALANPVGVRRLILSIVTMRGRGCGCGGWKPTWIRPGG